MSSPRLLGRSLPFPEIVPGLSSDDLHRLADHYLTLSSQRISNAPARVVNKMPDNVFLQGFLHLLFPRARFVICRRHPLDVCLSIFCQSFEFNRGYYCDLEEIAGYYRHFLDTTAYWLDQFPDQCHEIYYEQLVAEQEPTTRSLIEFCGLEWSKRCLRFESSGKGVFTASAWQVRQPIYTRSAHRWRHYAKQLSDLRDLLASEVTAHEAALESRLGAGPGDATR
jgi:hypothetical protein